MKYDFSMEDRGHFLKLRFVAWTDSLVADLHLPPRSANWVSAALPLASNWIPQLFLFNSQTSERGESVQNHNRGSEREAEEGE